MVRATWLALSVAAMAMSGSASSVYNEDGTRMVKHRKIARSGLHQRHSPAVELETRAYKKYTLSENYAGSKFFEDWDFFSESDPTNGNVNYLSRAEATSKKLAYVQNGTAIMKVDDTTWVASGGNRNSVRISSAKSFTGGLFVLDVLAMPHGCGVWPAFWTVGPSWPNGGEIDILEGVHNQASNQMTLHTSTGCTLNTGSLKLKSTILSKNCDAAVNSNAGCAFLDPDTASYGAGLNKAGGGVYAMLWDDDGISIWFFARENIPDDITNLKSADTGATANPSTWGTPKAHWASTTCSTSKFFKSHNLVFDTTLCGDWAGATYSSAGCPGTCADRLKDPANFKDAVWKINSVSIFT